MIVFVLLLITVQSAICDVKILLIHTNDMHARFKEVDRYLGTCRDPTSLTCFGGFARLHEAVRKLKEEAKTQGRSPIYLNAGDNFQGSPYYSVFKWGIVTEFVNVLGVDALTLGNHEFDDGVKGLAPYLQAVNAPVLCCNMDWSKEPSLQNTTLTPSVVLEVEGNKIGIIGYLTPIISKANTGTMTIFDEIASVKAEAKRLKKKGVRILIALGHSGYAKDMEIAKEVDDIDIVVGAHTHSFLYSGTPPDIDKPVGEYPTMVAQRSGKEVPVVQAFYATKYLGQIALDFDDDGNLKSFNGTPILLTGNMPQSSRILRMLQPYEQGIAQTKRIIGYTNVVLDNSNDHCRVSECELGNMISDAYVSFAVRHCRRSKITKGWTVASIGMNLAGSIRASIDTVAGGRNGSITLEDVMTAVPFGNRIVVIRVNGSLIREALENGVKQIEYINTTHVKDFLQVSGLRVTFNIGRESWNRVVDVKVLCADCRFPRFEDLIDAKEYGVVVPEFLANGGSGFNMFRGHKVECISNDTDYTIVSKYIERYSPLNPRIESRIIFATDEINIMALLVGISLLITSLILYCIIPGIHKPNRWKTHLTLSNNNSRSSEYGSTVIIVKEEQRRLLWSKE